jgi:hypothetical protein
VQAIQEPEREHRPPHLPQHSPVVSEGVGRGLLDAHEGLSVQDTVVHVDWVAIVFPLSLSLWDQGNLC